MMDPNTAGLDGIPPFDYVLVGLIFLGYFSTALLAFSAKIRSEQLLGTLEAMLVTPTPTALVIFFSASWEFAFGAADPRNPDRTLLLCRRQRFGKLGLLGTAVRPSPCSLSMEYPDNPNTM